MPVVRFIRPGVQYVETAAGVVAERHEAGESITVSPVEQRRWERRGHVEVIEGEPKKRGRKPNAAKPNG